ncbi:MAG TPA: hypothetical protein VNR00_19155, partial [Opitutus sp.]|nr:hypothetical protein [Opitutus sp.]
MRHSAKTSLGVVRRLASFVVLVSAMTAQAAVPTLEVPEAGGLRRENPVIVTGRADAGAELRIEAVNEVGERVREWRARADTEGRFALPVERGELPEGRKLVLRARVGEG